jgi:hypothetical protein
VEPALGFLWLVGFKPENDPDSSDLLHTRRPPAWPNRPRIDRNPWLDRWLEGMHACWSAGKQRSWDNPVKEGVLGPLATFGCSTRLAGMMRHTGCSKLFERMQKITARIESRNIAKIKKTATDAENAAGGWEVKERSQERD